MVSCLTMAPRFDTKAGLIAMRGPLTELNKDLRGGATPQGTAATNGVNGVGSMKKTPSVASEISPSDCYLSELHRQLRGVCDSHPAARYPAMEDEAEDPKCLPMIWVSKWVDYSDKYGFGYALSDESIGVLFNDVTKLLQLADGS